MNDLLIFAEALHTVHIVRTADEIFRTSGDMCDIVFRASAESCFNITDRNVNTIISAMNKIPGCKCYVDSMKIKLEYADRIS